MTTVLIQPSLGNPAARRHWADTMAHPVDFTSTQIAGTLTTDERAQLQAVHPSGTARVWGMTSNQDKLTNRLSAGDIVLFTGQSHVQGIGQVGVIMRNAALGNQLWKPHPGRGSYSNVYTVQQFEPTDIPYQDIWDLPSFNPGDNFMGARLLDETKSDEILQGLRINPAAPIPVDAPPVLPTTSSGAIMIPNEAINVTSTSYRLPETQRFLNRTEAQLVDDYRKTLATTTHRVRCDAGITDLCIEGNNGSYEIVEAKSSTHRTAVRTAIGQLLDYAALIPRATHLTILLPAAPENSIQTLTRNLGINLVWKEIQTETFHRQEAETTDTTQLLRQLRR